MNERTQHRHTDDTEPGAFRIPAWLLSVIAASALTVATGAGVWCFNANADIQSNKAQNEYTNEKLINYKVEVNSAFIEQGKRLDRIENKIDKLLDERNNR